MRSRITPRDTDSRIAGRALFGIGLGLAGYSGKMLLPLGIIDLTAGVLTLTGLFLLAERMGRDSLLSAAGVLCLAFGTGILGGRLAAGSLFPSGGGYGHDPGSRGGSTWREGFSPRRTIGQGPEDKAVCEFISGDWQAAVSDLKKAIALDPGGLEACLSHA